MNPHQERLLLSLIEALKAQAEASGPTPYVDTDDPRDCVLDGHFDLVAIAERMVI